MFVVLVLAIEEPVDGDLKQYSDLRADENLSWLFGKFNLEPGVHRVRECFESHFVWGPLTGDLGELAKLNGDGVAQGTEIPMIKFARGMPVGT